MEGSNNFYVKLEKQWFYNEKEKTLLQEYGEECLMVYTLILRNLTTRNTSSFSINALCSTLKVDTRKNTVMVNKIKGSIKRLNNGMFIVCSDSNCNSEANISKIDNSTIYYVIRTKCILKEKFIMIYDSEVDKLIKYSCKKRNSISELITHFAFICNGFKGISKKKEKKDDNEGDMCFYGTLINIAAKTGILQSTLLSNNKIFVEQDILLIGNAGGTITENKYTNTSNVYARKEHLLEFNAFMEIKKAKLGISLKGDYDKEQQNKQRELKQLINKYKRINGIEDYMNKDDLSVKQFQELFILETDHNKLALSRGKKTKDSRYLTIKENGEIKPQYIEALEVVEVIPSDGWGTIETKIKYDSPQL